VDRLLADPRLEATRRLYGSAAVATHARREVARLRTALDHAPLDEAAFERLLEGLVLEVAAAVSAALGLPPRRVLNVTGIFLHTNLGRAPLPGAVAERLTDLSTAGCDLELDLVTGERGDRTLRLAARLTELTGAEAALVVNNNAAALLLALASAPAAEGGREVIVSRGELVEIGGSFRVPEILAASGAKLIEVGTTNRTRLEDYERAIGPATAMLLKVHPSNYRMTGFVESVAIEPLAALARSRGVTLLVDEGAGLLRRPASPRAPLRFPEGHASVAELLGAGADLVTASGDKLLGGPQAGLLLGRAEPLARAARHPLYRALRPGRLVALALDGVLRRQLAGEELPLDRLWPEPVAHAARVARLAARLGGEVRLAEAFAGGGAAPGEGIAGPVVALAGDRLEAFATRLRTGDPPVVGYVRDDRLWLDLRTLDAADDAAVIAAVEKARAALPGGSPAMESLP